MTISSFGNGLATVHRYDASAAARYTRVAMILHWAIAAFIVFNLCTGFFMESWPPSIRMIGVMLHASSGLTVLALTPAADAADLEGLDPAVTARCAVMLGTEGPGLTGAALGAADLRVRIPMAHGVDSLNIAAAAAVAFWAVTRPPALRGRLRQ